MKRCPECRRDYYDETLLYCLDDGSALLDGPAKPEPPVSAGGRFDEPQTAIMSGNTLRGVENRLQQEILQGGHQKSESFWVAVLPFRYSGSDPDIQVLADDFLD